MPKKKVQDEKNPYTMKISLSVLNHLGIGLYSSIQAVLSEIVANAWDADAQNVSIDIDIPSGRITVEDDGYGMDRQDINEKYLNVGYRKRIKEPGMTPLGRKPMGRKGIGKLAVFSIADTVEIRSIKGSIHSAFRMHGPDIQQAIEGNDQQVYHPTPLEVEKGLWTVMIPRGTRITLTELKKPNATAEEFLRKQLARRFSILGAKYNFVVKINGVEITPQDRGFYENLEFVWYFGTESQTIVDQCSRLKQNFCIDPIIDVTHNYRIRGWIGTVDERKNMGSSKDQYNSIVIFAHGKLIHEDMLKDFTEGGIYKTYIIGEIEADFMDLDEEDDIVTSNRQSIKIDDERYKALAEFVWTVLKRIQTDWQRLRTQEGMKRALASPAIKEWFDRQTGENKEYAKKIFGRIESIPLPTPEAKRELYKASILAFERLALTHQLSILAQIENEEDFAKLIHIFGEIDQLEQVHYYEIIRGRIQVVRQFEKILPMERERVLQRYIFEHLWLLDPSWERAATNQRIEESVTRQFQALDVGLTEEERKGRIDIRYQTAAGKHIIIELKKHDRKVSVYELGSQVSKYRRALEKCLRNFDRNHPDIECICIVGQLPDEPAEEISKVLAASNTRLITYDTLISQTLAGYRDYLEKEKEHSDLEALLGRIDNEFAEQIVPPSRVALAIGG